MSCRRRCCEPCLICLGGKILEDSGEALQLEISGVTAVAGSPFCAASNGTFPIPLRSNDLLLLGPSCTAFIAQCFCAVSVDPDPGFNGFDITGCPVAFPVDPYFCCIYGGTTGSGQLVGGAIYGTTGGGLSAVMMLAGADAMYAVNLVLSASTRRIDCGAVDVSSSSITTVPYIPDPGTNNCTPPTLFRLSTI
jgi:hypothetical protein